MASNTQTDNNTTSGRFDKISLDKYNDFFIEEKGQKAIAQKDCLIIAKDYGLSPKEAEISLMEAGIVPLKYTGNVRTFGIDGQIKILQANVAVIGCGGLGGSIVEMCARLGVGSLRLFDANTFTEHNLNRQLLCTEETYGLSKSLCAARRIKSINSSLDVKAHEIFFNDQADISLLKGCDCVIDALDNAEDRIFLSKACRTLNIPMVHGAIGDTMLQVLLVKPGDDMIEKVYSSSTQNIPRGNPVITPMICASLEVAELVKLLLQNGTPLENELLFFNWLYNDFHIIPIS